MTLTRKYFALKISFGAFAITCRTCFGSALLLYLNYSLHPPVDCYQLTLGFPVHLPVNIEYIDIAVIS